MPQSSRQKQNKELGTRITNIFPITLAETKIICDNSVRAWVSPVFSSTLKSLPHENYGDWEHFCKATQASS